MDRIAECKAVKILVVGAIVLFLGLRVYRGWREVSHYQWDLRPELLAVSFVFTLAHWLAVALGWNMAVRSLGGDLDLRKGLRVYFLSNMARYIPGTVWYVAGRAYLGERERVSAAVISTSVVIEMALAIVSGALTSILALPLLLSEVGLGALYACVLVVALGLIALHPKVIKWLLDLLVRLLHRPNLVVSPPTYVAMLRLLLPYFLIWILGGAGFFTLLNSLYPLRLARLPIVAAIYAISYTVGFLIPLAPGGLGVREGIMALLLSHYVPLPVAAGVAILARLWAMVAEVFWAAFVARL